MDVKLVDHMGSDLTVVNAARVSFSKTSKYRNYNNEGDLTNLEVFHMLPGSVMRENGSVDYLSEGDAKLIGYLARGCRTGEWDKLIRDCHDGSAEEIEEILLGVKRMATHWTPFGHCQATLKFDIPFFVANQLKRSTVGFVINETSRRYVDDDPVYHDTELRLRAADVKQGSLDEVLTDERLINKYNTLIHKIDQLYKELIAEGVSPESARSILPQCTHTEFWMTGSLYGWANMYNQRIDPHSQKEIQQVAKRIGDIMSVLYPRSWKELTK